MASLKHIVVLLLRISGVPLLVREFVQRKRVTILVYHDVSPETADLHFTALRRRFSVISLDDYLSFRKDDSKQLPPKPLIVTLDDGHKANYALKPVLEKHAIRATIFLCSGIVGTNRHFWFKTEMSNSARQGLKQLSDPGRLDALAKIGFWEEKEYCDRQALSVGEVEDMKNVVDFQSHTVLHPILPQCSPARAFKEISDSKSELENRFGLAISALAYPNGDYSEREAESAKLTGYECALTLDVGFNSRSTPAYRLKRICINDDAGVDELLVKASGVWGLLKRIPYVFRRRPLSAPRFEPNLNPHHHAGILDEN